MRLFPTFLAAALCCAGVASAQNLNDLLGLAKSAGGNGAVAGLPEDKVVSGLKEALAKGTQSAVNGLGRTDGFLGDAKVKIPLPGSLAKVGETLHMLHMDKYSEELVTTMNRAAEQAVPVAASVLGDAVRNMSIADAKSILTGSNTAATAFFRRTSGPDLQARFLPIVKSATEKTGVSGAYKQMTEKATGGLGGFGGFGGAVQKEMPDLDGYITGKALDGLFLKIADEEKEIRTNPAARTTGLLQQVFGAVK